MRIARALHVWIFAAVLAACGGDGPGRTDDAVERRRLYVERLQPHYQEEGGAVSARGRYLETIELRIPQADALWCETFPAPENRDLLRDLGFRAVVVRNLERQVCWISLERS